MWCLPPLAAMGSPATSGKSGQVIGGRLLKSGKKHFVKCVILIYTYG